MEKGRTAEEMIVGSPFCKAISAPADATDTSSRSRHDSRATAESVIRIASDNDIQSARRRGRVLAGRLGFRGADQVLIDACISELSHSLYESGLLRGLVLAALRGNGDGRVGLQITTRGEPWDFGVLPVERNACSSPRKDLLQALSRAQRIMDDFRIAFDAGSGPSVTLVKWRR